MSKLRAGDVDSIFLDIVPKKFLERRLYIYLFGAGDRDDDYWNQIIKESISNMISEDSKELRGKFDSTYRKVYEYANISKDKFENYLQLADKDKAYEEANAEQFAVYRAEEAEARRIAREKAAARADKLISAIYKYGFFRCFTNDYETVFRKFKNSLYNEIKYENADINASIYVTNIKNASEIQLSDIEELDPETINKIKKFDSNIKIISVDELADMNPNWKSLSKSQRDYKLYALLHYGSWTNYR
jgi:hypothetical protein